MLRQIFLLVAICIAFTPVSIASAKKADKRNKNGEVTLSGEMKQWHAFTLNLAGPECSKTDVSPNPFTDYRFSVVFEHESGFPSYTVPGYFAADGIAAESGASSGNVWRAHLSPDRTGKWSYRISFIKGKSVAVNDLEGKKLPQYHGLTGTFAILPTDKSGRDFRGKGRLQYVGPHHLQFAGSGEYYLKAGPDSPETLLGTADFDNTIALKEEKVPLKTWSAHVKDWNNGDPVWHGEKGKGLIGALNYLAGKGMNSISFIHYNACGDGDNVWPFIKRDDKLHYDCSNLDQWGVVFAHAQELGLHLHFKLQENELDDLRRRDGAKIIDLPLNEDGTLRILEAMDCGETGPERKLYLREMIARYGHHLALNWNLNTLTRKTL